MPTLDRAAERKLLWLVATGIFMQMLDSTIVNTALPAMAHSLGESPLRMQSVVIAYSLTSATLISASGWVADRFGTRRAFLTAATLFTLGSLLCAWSQSLPQLVISRVVQGLGGAMLLPVGRLSVMRSVSRERLLPALSFVTIPALVGPLAGPTLGGWLVQVASWHWIFLINLPVGALALWATLKVMPDHRTQDLGRLDVPGFLLLAGGMVGMSLALDGFAERGLREATIVILLIFGLASLCGYWLHAVRVARPLFPLRLFTVTSYRIGILGNLFARIGSGSMPYLTPLMLQIGLGFSPMDAGMMLIPSALAGMLAKQAVVWLVRRYGYRRVALSNTLLVGLMMASYVLVHEAQPVWLLCVQLAMFGAVNSIQFTVMNTLTLRDLDQELASSGNSLLSMVMMLSMSFAVAIAGSVLAGFNDMFQTGSHALSAFHATFLCMGAITLASSLIFAQLEADPRGNVAPKVAAED